jgi:hypothetical protein
MFTITPDDINIDMVETLAKVVLSFTTFKYWMATFKGYMKSPKMGSILCGMSQFKKWSLKPMLLLSLKSKLHKNIATSIGTMYLRGKVNCILTGSYKQKTLRKTFYS